MIVGLFLPFVYFSDSQTGLKIFFLPLKHTVDSAVADKLSRQLFLSRQSGMTVNGTSIAHSKIAAAAIQLWYPAIELVPPTYYSLAFPLV